MAFALLRHGDVVQLRELLVLVVAVHELQRLPGLNRDVRHLPRQDPPPGVAMGALGRLGRLGGLSLLGGEIRVIPQRLEAIFDGALRLDRLEAAQCSNLLRSSTGLRSRAVSCYAAIAMTIIALPRFDL